MPNKKFLHPHISTVVLLTIPLATIYIWFGILKVFTVSPVYELIKICFPFMPQPLFLHVLGIGEVVIGAGLLWKKTRKLAALLIIPHMGGIFTGLLLRPDVYFVNGNLLLLTTYGEFVIKNVLLIAAALVIYKES